MISTCSAVGLSEVPVRVDPHGGQLIGAVLGYANENGFARVVLSPTERSIPFYQRAGFGAAHALILWKPADRD